jgi:hypothetical protein
MGGFTFWFMRVLFEAGATAVGVLGFGASVAYWRAVMREDIEEEEEAVGLLKADVVRRARRVKALIMPSDPLPYVLVWGV